MARQSDPSEAELTRWVQGRLEQMGRAFAEPEGVAETLDLHHDLWVSLYRIEHGFEPLLPELAQAAEAPASSDEPAPP